jgi:DNA-binding TFAR19-related protein (PDSD5 family)
MITGLTGYPSISVKRVKLVKRDLVDKVERFLEQQAMGGKLRNLVTEPEIIDLLTKVGASAATDQKIVIARKRYGDEEEEDDDDDLR